MSVFGTLDTGFPNLNKYGSTEQKLRAIESYLVQLLEQLRYTLNNLSQDNFNTKEVTGWLGQVVTEPVLIAVESASAGEWASGTQYKTDDVVKVTSAGTVNFYKCLADHTASGANKPPSSSWEPIKSDEILRSRFEINSGEIRSEVNRATYAEGGLNDAISAVDQKADSIQLQVTGTSAPEWVASHSYAKNDVVKVTTAATQSTPQSITYYKAKANHTSSAGNKPPSSSWEVTVAPNVNSMIDLNLNGLTLSYDNDNIGSTEHNGSYIKLMKDGTFIGGGKVFIKDLDADTIVTGTLDAGHISLRDQFDYVVNVSDNTGDVKCGTIGGAKNLIAGEWTSVVIYHTGDVCKITNGSTVTYYKCRSNGTTGVSTKPPNATYWTVTTERYAYDYNMYIRSSEGDQQLWLANDHFVLSSSNGANDAFDLSAEGGKVNITFDNYLKMQRSGTTSPTLQIDGNHIYISKKVGGTTYYYDLLDLITT